METIDLILYRIHSKSKAYFERYLKRRRPPLMLRWPRFIFPCHPSLLRS
jgi:hypothetical protein